MVLLVGVQEMVVFLWGIHSLVVVVMVMVMGVVIQDMVIQGGDLMHHRLLVTMEGAMVVLLDNLSSSD